MLPNYVEINLKNNIRNNFVQDDSAGSNTAGPTKLHSWQVVQLLSRSFEGFIFVVEEEGIALRGVKSALGRIQKLYAQVIGVNSTKLKQGAAGFGCGKSED